MPSARSEALQQLAQFQSGIRQQLDTYEPARPVSPPRMQVVASASASADVVTTEQPTAPPAEKAGLLELNAETFWPHLESAGDDLVVVDFFTDWCGPCKLMYPELVKISEELSGQGVQVVKFNCNAANKDLAKMLGIKVAPTFHLYRGSNKVGEMTGAKTDKLRSMIEEAMNKPEEN